MMLPRRRRCQQCPVVASLSGHRNPVLVVEFYETSAGALFPEPGVAGVAALIVGAVISLWGVPALSFLARSCNSYGHDYAVVPDGMLQMWINGRFTFLHQISVSCNHARHVIDWRVAEVGIDCNSIAFGQAALCLESQNCEYEDLASVDVVI